MELLFQTAILDSPLGKTNCYTVWEESNIRVNPHVLTLIWSFTHPYASSGPLEKQLTPPTDTRQQI